MSTTRPSVLALVGSLAACAALRVPEPELVARGAAHVALVGCLCCGVPFQSLAVSGGGKDYSNAGLEDQDFSGQKLSGKEFRGIRGANINFKDSKLDATSFFKSDLSNAVFTGADLTGASLEEAGLDGVRRCSGSTTEAPVLLDACMHCARHIQVHRRHSVVMSARSSCHRGERSFGLRVPSRGQANFADALLVNSYLTATILQASEINGADFTDAVVPVKVQKALCARQDAAGKNTKSGVDTRESLMCPD